MLIYITHTSHSSYSIFCFHKKKKKNFKKKNLKMLGLKSSAPYTNTTSNKFI